MIAGGNAVATIGRKQKAFTAFEALLASAILAFLTATVSAALMAGRQQSKLARDTLNASFLAQSLMDEINVFLYGVMLDADEKSTAFGIEQQDNAAMLRWVSIVAAIVIVLVVSAAVLTMMLPESTLSEKDCLSSKIGKSL